MSSFSESSSKLLLTVMYRYFPMYWSRATGWTARVQFPTGATDLSVLRIIQTCSGAHPMSTGGKAAGA
jgi:hypothetical protein